MSQSSLAAAGNAERLTCLDEVRAIAIAAMIIAHFAPGVFDRLPALGWIQTSVLLLGKFATPAFVAIFGVTVGFVYLDKARRSGVRAVRDKLLRRAWLLLGCALLIRVPHYISLILAHDDSAASWLYWLSSILSYYALAVASLPLWFWLILPRPLPRCIICGVGLWVLGTCSVTSLWHHDANVGLKEFARLNLVSGAYAYTQMMGTALLAMPVGIALRSALRTGTLNRLFIQVLLIGSAIMALGWVWGLACGEFALREIVSGALKAPPRAWYFAFFGGACLVVLALLGLLGRIGWFQWIMHPLALSGQCALPIYTAHVFVLPLLAVVDCFIALEGVPRMIVPFGVFAMFWAAIICRRHFAVQRAVRSSRAVGPQRQERMRAGESVEAVPLPWLETQATQGGRES